MIYKEDKYCYSRNFKLSLIASLLICVIIILYWPKGKDTIENEIAYYEPMITVIDIPKTKQSGSPDLIPPPPKLELSNIFDIVEDYELPDVEIEETTITEKIGASKEQPAKLEEDKPYEFSALPFIPRQILEVVPEKVNNSEGVIKLSILIGKNGKPQKHKVLKNTTNKMLCYDKVIEAVYKSKWQPILIEGDLIEYWIEKSYLFN
ncbi:MAG: hypothetical protein PVH88_15120 [Ignavibacteria bacterium]|jgi:hypothetical protein